MLTSINHMSLNEALVIFHTQLSPFGFLPCSFHLAANWLQAWLPLEFVQLHSTLVRELHRGAAAVPVSPQHATSPSFSRGMGQGVMPGHKGYSRSADLWHSGISCSSPKFFTNSQTPHSGFDELAFQKLFSIRNGFLSTPSFLPQRISHSSRETDKSFLSEFKYKFIFKTGLITKLQFVLCEGICLYHKNHSC